MFICAGESEQFIFAKNIGIGLISSAINLTKLCLQYLPKELIFIGSAGCYTSTTHHIIINICFCYIIT